MQEWAAWQDTRALAILHSGIRQLLVAQGVGDHFVDVDDHRVHLYEAGPENAERTVVLLHGLGDSANNWCRTLPLLAWRGDRVIAIDLAGHGLSACPNEQGYLSVREHADIVRKVVAERAVGTDLAVVGHSLGGWVAAQAHLRGLDASKMVLVEAAGLAHEGMWETLELLRIEHEEDVRRFFRTICHHPPFGLNLVSKEVASMFRCPAVQNFIAASDPDDIIPDDRLAEFRADTTVIWGEEDGLIPPILAHRWNAGIPGSRLVWMPECGHAPQFERPVLFQRLLEEALGHPPMMNAIRDRVASHMPEMLRRRLGMA